MLALVAAVLALVDALLAAALALVAALLAAALLAAALALVDALLALADVLLDAAELDAALDAALEEPPPQAASPSIATRAALAANAMIFVLVFFMGSPFGRFSFPSLCYELCAKSSIITTPNSKEMLRNWYLTK